MISKRAVFDQQEALYKDLLEQIKQCHVIAEHSGIVVYTVPEQTRMGSGATQSIIAQGEPVQYGQKMMSIPDLSHMLVNVRVHEAFINHMEVEARVDSVNPDGPAEKAGLKAGDVVAKLGNKRVKAMRICRCFALPQAGYDGQLTVQRGKEDHEVDLTLAPRPVEPPVNGGGNPPTPTAINRRAAFFCPSVTAVPTTPTMLSGCNSRGIAGQCPRGGGCRQDIAGTRQERGQCRRTARLDVA